MFCYLLTVHFECHRHGECCLNHHSVCVCVFRCFTCFLTSVLISDSEVWQYYRQTSVGRVDRACKTSKCGGRGDSERNIFESLSLFVIGLSILIYRLICETSLYVACACINVTCACMHVTNAWVWPTCHSHCPEFWLVCCICPIDA